jgi:hypothetical protein
MKRWINDTKLYLIGALLGAISGFLYWKFVGCNSGTCAITSNPSNSTIYGAIMGALVLSLFKREATIIKD